VVTAADALEITHALDRAGVRYSIEGGWGVDALLGRETRLHRDIDLAIPRESCDHATSALQVLGFRKDLNAAPGLPARSLLIDDDRRQVDLHPLLFDAAGNGWQHLSNGGWYLHNAADLWRDGTIEGAPVRCISPELQLIFRLGYQWQAEDVHDLTLLSDEFSIPLPPGAD
jgi:lincosamide nucleotidyltransferase A/C/D/E